MAPLRLIASSLRSRKEKRIRFSKFVFSNFCRFGVSKMGRKNLFYSDVGGCGWACLFSLLLCSFSVVNTEVELLRRQNRNQLPLLVVYHPFEGITFSIVSYRGNQALKFKINSSSIPKSCLVSSMSDRQG